MVTNAHRNLLPPCFCNRCIKYRYMTIHTYSCPSSNTDYKGKYGYLLVQKNTRMQYTGCKICAKWTLTGRNLYTWKAPDQIWHHLDYILVKHRFWCSMKNEQTLPGSATHSDQKLLVAKICTRYKKIIKFQKGKPQWDLENLYAK